MMSFWPENNERLTANDQFYVLSQHNCHEQVQTLQSLKKLDQANNLSYTAYTYVTCFTLHIIQVQTSS